MSRHMVPVTLGLSVFPLSAIGIAAFVLTAPSTGAWLMSGAIFLLACGMVLAGGSFIVVLGQQQDSLAAQQSALRDVTASSLEAMKRLSVLEQRDAFDPPASPRGEDTAAGGGTPRRQPGEPPRSPRPVVSSYAQKQFTAEKAVAPKRSVSSPIVEAPAGRDELTLWLEPIVDLKDGVTQHYRALIGLTDSRGKTVTHDEVTQKADHSGLRPSIDARLVRMAMPVLSRLRNRNPGLRIILPLGRQTLSAREEAGRLLSLLRHEPDLANGLVFEFAQQDLGRLDATGIDNLARLARAGAALALREVYVGGLDLAALRQLGVCYLSFPPYAADAGSGPSASWTKLVTTARSLQINLVIDGIENRQQAVAAGKYAQFGKGPYFAPPRKVRADAGQGPISQRNASAA
ncbi:EAL domain-containing protein [Aestuariivirga sp.]|uniref:EAL domain-containing protein n=1 Tax=Aestuariivirga sp. TaxID=2650926 RepID=UPI00378479F5